MKLTEYEYRGPDSGITLQDKASSTDVLFRQGKRVSLPDDNAAVKTLVAQGYLVEVSPAQVPAAVETSKPSASAKPSKSAKE